jgi:hypothetical protein
MEQPSQAELDLLWETEINRRGEAVQKGEFKLIPG